MGYFSNGTEGMMYQDEFCSRCINWRDTGDGRGFGCPIIDLHYLWNYEAIGSDGDKTKAEALNHFIPRNGVLNGQCKMFYAAVPAKFKCCSKCDNPTDAPVEKIEGVLCAACAGKLEQQLIKKNLDNPFVAS